MFIGDPSVINEQLDELYSLFYNSLLPVYRTLYKAWSQSSVTMGEGAQTQFSLGDMGFALGGLNRILWFESSVLSTDSGV